MPAARGRRIPAPVRLEPPEGVEGVLVIPGDEVPTAEARAALPAEVPLEAAVDNVAAATQLALGIERSDLALIRRGLQDRLHQPHRRELYARSMSLVADAPGLGALGATISGAGPTVLVWSFWQDTGKVAAALSPSEWVTGPRCCGPVLAAGRRRTRALSAGRRAGRAARGSRPSPSRRPCA